VKITCLSLVSVFQLVLQQEIVKRFNFLDLGINDGFKQDRDGYQLRFTYLGAAGVCYDSDVSITIYLAEFVAHNPSIYTCSHFNQ
jgi:hypothetical protein